jgi:hypothetical protein
MQALQAVLPGQSFTELNTEELITWLQCTAVGIAADAIRTVSEIWKGNCKFDRSAVC